tara:strand:- start:17 stop:706 length:690 start_codon:yes stop_codon:yes gene_type:complete
MELQLKLNDETREILKNFSTINANLVVKPGSIISTMAETKTCLATATLAESFNNEFGLYDLNEFLSAMSMFDDPELDFADDNLSVSIKQGSRSVKYFLSDTTTLTSPSKPVVMPSTEVQFVLSADEIASIRKASSALGASDMIISNGDVGVRITVTNSNDNTSNQYNVEVAASQVPSENFKLILSIPNLKIIPGDYAITLSSKLISHFKHTTRPIEYWIAVEKNSTYGE